MPDADVLQRRPAAGFEVASDGIEIGAPPALAHRFDHLDRGDGVELLSRVAVILKADLDPVAKAGFGDLLVGPGLLLRRQCQADDLGAALRRLDRQAAPAAADLQQPLARPQIQTVEQKRHLAPLGVFEAVLRRGETRR